MSRRSWLPLAVVLLVAVGASMARADDIITSGTRYQNVRNGQYTDAAGNALNVDGYRPAWGTAVYTNAINDTVTIEAGVFAAESTIVLPFAVNGYKWCVAYLDIKHAAGDTSITWVAVEPRSHFAAVADSVYMGVWPQFGTTAASTGATAGVAAMDSTTGDFFRSFGTTIVPAAGTGQKAWTGERVVAVWPTRGRGDEGAPQLWGFPRQKVIELKGPAGDWLTALYVSWRVRILYGPVAATSKVRIVLHVVMGV